MKNALSLMIPGPTEVSPEVCSKLSEPMQPHYGPEFVKLYFDVVEKLKKIYQTSADFYVISATSSSAMEIAISHSAEPGQIRHALKNSEYSEKLNTSFIERLNLTIRRNTAYLHRQTPSHARCPQALAAQLDLQRCYYNFMRPHMSLKFGPETWTPAMMAGIAKRKLTWRDVLSYFIFVRIFFPLAAQSFSKSRAQAAA